MSLPRRRGAQLLVSTVTLGEEWHGGRVLDFGPRGPEFESRAVPKSDCIICKYLPPLS